MLVSSPVLVHVSPPRSKLRSSALIAFVVVVGRNVAAPLALVVFMACSRYLSTATVLIGADDSYFAYSQMDPIMYGGCPNCNIGCLKVFAKLAHFSNTLLLSKPAFEALFPLEEYDYSLLSDAAKELATRVEASETSTCMSGVDEWGSRAILLSGTPREVLDAVDALDLSISPKVLREVQNALETVSDCPTRWVLDTHTRVFRFRVLTNSFKPAEYSTIPAADVSIFPEYTECRGDVSNNGLVGETLAAKTHGIDPVSDIPDRMRVFPYSFRSSMGNKTTEVTATDTIYKATTVTQQMLRGYYGGCRVREVNTTGIYIEEGCKMDSHWLNYGLMVQTPDDLPVCSTADVCVHNYYNSLWEFVTWTDPSNPNRFGSAVNSFRVRYADAVPLSVLPGIVVMQILVMGWVSLYQTMSRKRSVLLAQIWAYRCQTGRMQPIYIAQATYHLAFYSDLYLLGLTTGTLTTESVGNLVMCLFAFSYSLINTLRSRLGEQQLDRHFRLGWELVQILSTTTAAVVLCRYRTTSLSIIMERIGELLRKTSPRGAKYCNLSDSCIVFDVDLAEVVVLMSLGLGVVAFAIKLSLCLVDRIPKLNVRSRIVLLHLQTGRSTSVVPALENKKIAPAVHFKANINRDAGSGAFEALTSFERHCLGHQFSRLFKDCGDFAYVVSDGARCCSVEAVLLSGFIYFGGHIYSASSMPLLLLSRILPQGLIRTFNVLLVRWRVDPQTKAVDAARMATCPDHAKPLALHGLTTAQHEIRAELVESLRLSGLDLVAGDSEGWTELHCAAKLGQLHAVRSLLSANEGQIDRSRLLEAATASGGWRALHLAIESGHLSIVEELLLADADVNARLATPEAPTPLLLASTVHGGEKVTDLLLQCGADPTLATRTLARNALHLAVAKQRVETVRVLLARTSLINSVDAQGVSPLQDAWLLPQSSASKDKLLAMLETAVRSEQQQGKSVHHCTTPVLNSFLSSAVMRS